MALAGTMSDRQIGETLGISVGTVKAHLMAIRDKGHQVQRPHHSHMQQAEPTAFEDEAGTLLGRVYDRRRI